MFGSPSLLALRRLAVACIVRAGRCCLWDGMEGVDDQCRVAERRFAQARFSTALKKEDSLQGHPVTSVECTRGMLERKVRTPALSMMNQTSRPSRWW